MTFLSIAVASYVIDLSRSTRFHPILHIKEVLDCFRLDLLLILLVLLLCVRVCVCFNLLSDNDSNTVRVIWHFVMLYNYPV